jgi:5,10-methylenetetrahydrofolate reductase
MIPINNDDKPEKFKELYPMIALLNSIYKEFLKKEKNESSRNL